MLFKNTMVAILPMLLPKFDFKLEGSLSATYKLQITYIVNLKNCNRILEEFSYKPLSVQ